MVEHRSINGVIHYLGLKISFVVQYGVRGRFPNAVVSMISSVFHWVEQVPHAEFGSC